MTSTTRAKSKVGARSRGPHRRETARLERRGRPPRGGGAHPTRRQGAATYQPAELAFSCNAFASRRRGLNPTLASACTEDELTGRPCSARQRLSSTWPAMASSVGDGSPSAVARPSNHQQAGDSLTPKLTHPQPQRRAVPPQRLPGGLSDAVTRHVTAAICARPPHARTRRPCRRAQKARAWLPPNDCG